MIRVFWHCIRKFGNLWLKNECLWIVSYRMLIMDSHGVFFVIIDSSDWMIVILLVLLAKVCDVCQPWSDFQV